METTKLTWESSVEDVAKAYELEEPLQCSCCESPGVHLNVTQRTPRLNPRKDDHEFLLLCDICYSTHLGRYFQYPEQHDHDAMKIMKLVAYVGNEIIKRLPPSQG